MAPAEGPGAAPSRPLAREAAEADAALGVDLYGVLGADAERLRLLLREIFTAAGGTHDDFGAYDRVMAEERRVAVLVAPARISPRG